MFKRSRKYSKFLESSRRRVVMKKVMMTMLPKRSTSTYPMIMKKMMENGTQRKRMRGQAARKMSLYLSGKLMVFPSTKPCMISCIVRQRMEGFSLVLSSFA